MLAGKTLTEFTNLFSPNNFKKDDNIILKLWKMLKMLKRSSTECTSIERDFHETPYMRANISNDQQFMLKNQWN